MPFYLNLNKVKIISIGYFAVKLFFMENPDSSHLFLMFLSFLIFC